MLKRQNTGWKKPGRRWAMALITVCLCLSGCGSEQPERAEKFISHEEANNMTDWRRTLPRDTGGENLVKEAVCGLSVEKEGAPVFEVSYAPRDYKASFDYWNITVPYESRVTADTEALYSLFDAAARITYAEAGGISPEEAGIPDSRTSLFLAYAEGGQTVKQGELRPDKAREIVIGKENGQGSYYAAFKDTSVVYCIGKSQVDPILEVDPFSCILKVAQLVNLDTISQVTIKEDNKTNTMRREDDTYCMDGEEVSPEIFKESYEKLLGVLISGEIPEESSPDKNREAMLTLQFFRNTEEAGDVELIYYEFDENNASVSVNGKEYFLVNKEDVELIKRELS